MTIDERIAALQVNIESLHATAVKDSENIRALPHIVELSEQRLTRLKDGSDNR
jgi:hypothetical protein